MVIIIIIIIVLIVITNNNNNNNNNLNRLYLCVTVIVVVVLVRVVVTVCSPCRGVNCKSGLSRYLLARATASCSSLLKAPSQAPSRHPRANGPPRSCLRTQSPAVALRRQEQKSDGPAVNERMYLGPVYSARLLYRYCHKRVALE